MGSTPAQRGKNTLQIGNLSIIPMNKIAFKHALRENLFEELIDEN